MSTTLSNRIAENYVDYQERATEFAPGDLVVPFGHSKDVAGKVTAVWPAIGMVDVEFSAGNKRYSVDDLQRLAPNGEPLPPNTNTTPGGSPTVSVPGSKMATRVAQEFVKKSLYWNQRDRRYRATRPELDGGQYRCPKCGEHHLKPAVYKRREGLSEKLLGCPGCLFLVKKQDILNDPCNAVEDEVA